MILIDLHYIINVMLPPVHRINEIIKYIQAVIKPLDDVLQEFYVFFEQNKYNLQFNGQVMNLERLLNEQFDNVANGIYITDAINVNEVFLFNKEEGNELTFLHNKIEVADPYYLQNSMEIENRDFIVNIPSAVVYNADLLKFYVNKYRAFGKRWKINIV